MSSSMAGDMGSTLDRAAIEKVVVEMISDKINVKSESEFWDLAAEEAGSKYNCTRGANAVCRIYLDIRSKNKELPNEKEFIKRMVRKAERHDLEDKQKESDKPNEVYRDVEKTYDNAEDRRLQQIAGAALAEMERRESEAKANASAGGSTKKGGAKGKGKQKE